jgi:hypothetical protein
VIAIGAAVAAVAGIGGTALAHESATVGDSFVGDFARHLGVSPAKVRDAYRAAVVDRIEAAVKAGRLTRAQADALEARIRSHGAEPFGFGPPGGGFAHRPFGHDGPFEHHGPSPFAAIATYLGISDDAVRKALGSGQTLAQLAAAKGKTVAGLEGAMTASIRARLAAGVKAGRLTDQQSARILDAVTARLDDFVRHGFRHDFPHHHHPLHSESS